MTVATGHLVARFEQSGIDRGSGSRRAARCDIWYVDSVVPEGDAGDVGPLSPRAAKLVEVTDIAILAERPGGVQFRLHRSSDTGAAHWLAVDEVYFAELVERLGRNIDDLSLPVLTLQTTTSEERAAVWRTVRAAAPVVRERVSRYVERGSVGEMVKLANGYRCQICEALGWPATGFPKVDGTLFAEAHHVVPVSTLGDDVLGPANVIVVCPNHHRQLHFGGVVQADEGSVFRFDFPFGQPTVRVKKFVQPT